MWTTLYLTGLAALLGGQDVADKPNLPGRQSAALFAVIDTNHDGGIDIAELQTQVQGLFKLVDADRDGKISPNEADRVEKLARFLSGGKDTPRSGAAGDRLDQVAASAERFEGCVRRAITQTDRNHDGLVTPDEIHSAVHQRGQVAVQRLCQQKKRIEADLERQVRRLFEHLVHPVGSKRSFATTRIDAPATDQPTVAENQPPRGSH